MADGKVKLEVEVTGKNAKIVQREVEGVTDAVNENTAAQRRNEKATRQASGAVGEATKVHKHYDRGLKGASGSSSSVSKNFSKMRDVMGGSSGLVGAYATLAANLFAASAAFTALQKAAQLEQISSGLTYLGKATGVAMGSLSSNLQKATGYGISLGESMKSVALVTTAGFDPSYIERLGKVARNTSTALGRDLSDSLDRLVRGAVKLEPELLDELGIMVRIDDATSKYAASLGKSAASLTTFEKQQAFMNTVLEEGEKKFGGIGDSVEINPYDKLSASLQELAKTFLNLVNVALKPFVSFLADNKEILAGFIAVLSKSVITQAFEAFTDFSKVQAVVAGQQKNIAVAADAAAKRSVETQKAKEVEAQAEAEPQEEVVVEKKEEVKGEGLEKKAEQEKSANETKTKPEPKKEEPKAEEGEEEEVGKLWFEDDEEEVSVNASLESKANNVDVEALKNEYESRLQQYEAVLNDEFIQSYLNTREAGKDLSEFFENIKPKDANQMTDEQLIRYECEKAGITDEDAIEQELDTLSSLTLLQKKKRLDSIRNEVQSENAEKLKRYNAETKKVAEDKKVVFNKAIQELEATTNELVDKNIYGLKITKEIADDIKDLYLNRQMPVFNSNGSPDIAASIELAIYRNYMKTLVKANVNAAKTEGKKEVLKKITNPSANNTASSRIVETRSELDDIASAMEEFENRGYKAK